MKHLYFVLCLLFLLIFKSFSQVNTNPTIWTPYGTGTTIVSDVFDDTDNGDGVGDGAKLIDGQTSNMNQGVSYTFGGTMVLGEEINISTFTYNRNASFVKFVVVLKNKTDGVTLAQSSEITHLGNNTTPINTVLNYTVLTSDVNDELQIFYIRTDDGNVLRDFTIDNLKLTQPCSFYVNKDLALIASNATIDSEITEAVNKFSNSYLGTSAPTTSQLSTAENQYNALNINVTGGNITGNTITAFTQASFLRVFARYLKFNPSDANIKAKANNAVWWFSKQFCEGVLDLDIQLYAYEDFARPASLLNNFLEPETKRLFEYSLYKHSVAFEHFWAPTYDVNYQEDYNSINTDIIYNIGDVLLAYSLWQETSEERYRYMRAYKRYMDRFFSYTVGTTDGIKPDGSGFHHWVAYNNYMYVYNTAAEILSYLSDTSFQVGEANYNIFRDAFYTQFIQSNDTGVQALSTSGRNPQSRTRPLNSGALRNIAIAGGKILGLPTADPVFAGMYNRIYGVDAAFNYSTVAPFESGFFQFNHASASAFRKDDWVVFHKGFSNNMWGSEIYTNQNRYGRYQSYGAQEVIYPGTKDTGNGYDHNTWDWNFNPGTTVIKLPWDKLHAERGRIDEEQQKRFVGTLNLKNKNSTLLNNNHGDYGMFAMDFQEKKGQGFSLPQTPETHNSTFTFKKSSFYFDDIIVSLGSGITNNDASNETVTTLFQRLDNKGNGVNVNGVDQSANGTISYAGTANNWLISNYGTGFYLVSGNDNLVLKKELQQTPNQNQNWPVDFSSNTTAVYYTGYINHGVNPANRGYEYILKPGTNVMDMEILDAAIQAANKPYIVHKKDASAHIVEHVSKKIWGYAFFDVATNLSYDVVTHVNASCLVMTEYNSSDETLFLSVVDPDIGFNSKAFTPSIPSVKEITLRGAWSLNEYYSGISIISSSDVETVLQFNLVDGLSKEVLLNETTYVNPDYPIVFYEDFLNEVGSGFSKFVVNSGLQNLNDIMKRVSDIPDLADSNNQFDPSTDRPENRIPNGNLSNQRAISTTGNNATTNFPVDAYAVFNTLDLTDANPRINPSDIYKYASFWTQRRYGNGDIANISILVSTAYTGDPVTTIWTTLPLVYGKIAETSDGLKYVQGVVDLSAYANGVNGSTVTLAYRYQGNSTAYDATNRNGTFYFSDLKFYVQSTALSVSEDKWVDQEIAVFPNPARSVVNVKLLDQNIQLKNLRVTDISGKIIFTGNTKTINVSGFSKGLYFLSIETNTGKVITKKVIID